MKTLIICLLSTLLLITGCQTAQPAGATSTSSAFYIHASAENGFTDIDDAYAIITDTLTGDMFHATTGAVDATWTNCDIAFTKDAQNPYWSGCTIPALDTSKLYAITIYEDVGGDGSETNADPIRIDALLYDPTTAQTYTDTNPMKNQKIRSINE